MSANPAGRAVRVLVMVCAVVCMCTGALAQSSTEGAIGGLVSDPQKAVIPNAKVTVVNLANGKEDAGTADGAGRFRIIHLQPSTYSVSVSAPGFAPYRQENVVVEVGRVTDVEVTLGIAGKTETVEVHGEAPVIQTEQQSFDSNINQTSINQLPINGRRWQSFALLTPGTMSDGEFGLISFRGISGLLNNNTVDGADNNQAFYSEERGRTRIQSVISSSAIQEFQVNTSNYSAEYGRAAGGVVNAVSKSGTNRLHGEAFYYNRNNELGAFNPFTKATSIVNGALVTAPIKPENVRHQFGGAVGGPLIKDKLFFFFAYDQQHHNFPGLGTTNSPTFLTPITVAPAVAGKACTNAGLSGLTPGQVLGTCGITQAQSDAAIQNLVGLTGTVARQFNQFTVFPKLDWQASRNHRLSLSYNRMRWYAPAGVQTQAVVFRAKDGFGNDLSHTDMAVARLTSTFGNRLSNEFRYQWGRDLEKQDPQQPLPGQPTTGPDGDPPEVCVNCGSTGSVINGFVIGRSHSVKRTQPDEKRNQIADTMAVALGRHLLKFGGDFNHVWDLQDQLFFDSPEYIYPTLEKYIVDVFKPASKLYTNYQQGFGPTAFHFTTNDYNFFGQDDWHVNSRLTLNLGLRWEYEQVSKPIIPNPAVPQTGRFPSDKNNFGPRIGFALDLFGTGKTALRGGYGLYYGRLAGNQIIQALTLTGMPGGQTMPLFTPTTAGSPQYPQVLASGAGAPSNPVFFQKDFQLPMIHEADLLLEQEVARNTVVTVSWLFSKGQNLTDFIDTNLNPPTGTENLKYVGGPLDGQVIPMQVYLGTRPNPAFSNLLAISSRVESNYNAGVIQLNRRFTNGLQFQNSYTYSHAIDNGQASTTFTPSSGYNHFDAFNLQLDKANSNFDIRQRFVSSIVWVPQAKFTNPVLHALLEDWTLAQVFSANTGKGVTPSVSGSNPATSSTQAGGINGSFGSLRVPALPRNFLHLPNPWLLDMRVSRRFRIAEGKSVELLADVFNVANHVNATSIFTTMYAFATTAGSFTPCTAAVTTCSASLNFNPNGNLGAVSNGNSSGPNGQYRERQIQLAVRFYF